MLLLGVVYRNELREAGGFFFFPRFVLEALFLVAEFLFLSFVLGPYALLIILFRNFLIYGNVQNDGLIVTKILIPPAA